MSQTVYEHATVHLILYYLNELTLRCVISQYQPAFYRVIDHLVTNNRPLLSVSVRRKTLSIINDSPSSHQTGRIIQMCIKVLFCLDSKLLLWGESWGWSRLQLLRVLHPHYEMSVESPALCLYERCTLSHRARAETTPSKVEYRPHFKQWSQNWSLSCDDQWWNATKANLSMCLRAETCTLLEDFYSSIFQRQVLYFCTFVWQL